MINPKDDGYPLDLEAAALWLSHDNQDKLTVAFGKALIAEVRRRRSQSGEASVPSNSNPPEIPNNCRESPGLREAEERVARHLAGAYPDKLEPGDFPSVDGQMRNGEPGHFWWRNFLEQAKGIVAALHPPPETPYRDQVLMGGLLHLLDRILGAKPAEQTKIIHEIRVDGDIREALRRWREAAIAKAEPGGSFNKGEGKDES